mmetsp:Transcript_58995/g.113765  ORF Transcript_58995/g.113765 Transcript_58995/m.113765 type:complete len:600 (-) Transcript_58995:407-2206(-)
MRFLKDMDTVLKMAGEATLQLGFVVLMVVFISGIITTNMLWDASDPEVREKFAYLGRSMWTMYSLMTMDNWTEQVMQIMQTKPGMFLFFILYIFVAAITLMSLTPAIFVQLNMHRREQEAEARILHKKEEFIKRHANMMDELFKMTDTNHNEMISMNEMKQLIMDKPKMGTLKDKSVLEEGMLRTVMLSIFDFWDESSFEYAEKPHEFCRKEFTQHIMDRLTSPHADTILCGVATRKMVHDLSTQAIALQAQMYAKLERMDEAFRSEMAKLRSAVQAKGRHVAPEAEREDELTRASLRALWPYPHGRGGLEIKTHSGNQGELLQHSLRSLQENHTPSGKKTQQGAIPPPLPPPSTPPSTYLEASLLATRDRNSGSAGEHPFQCRPRSTDNKPLQQKKKHASELGVASNAERFDSELFAQCEVAPLVSDTERDLPNFNGTQTSELGVASDAERFDSELLAQWERHRLKIDSTMASQTKRKSLETNGHGWKNFYSGTRGLPQIGSDASAILTEGGNKIGIQDDVSIRYSLQDGNKTSASREPAPSPRQAARTVQRFANQGHEGELNIQKQAKDDPAEKKKNNKLQEGRETSQSSAIGKCPQ